MRSLERALALGAQVIAMQGTSADPGPYYLGAGKTFYPLGGVRRDLATLLPHSRAAGVPVVVSVGGAGARASVQPVVDAVHEIAQEIGGTLRVAVIYADIDKSWLTREVAAGSNIPRLGTWPTLSASLTCEDIGRSSNIVAQMGPEPIMRALETGVDLVLCGRTLDASLFAALPILRGCDPGVSLHMGKTVECGAMAAIPGTGADGVIATVEDGRFTVEPLALERRCTIRSIAAHSFYERSDPDYDDLPGGQLDTSKVTYDQIDPRTVRVVGSRWHPSERYTVKLEGAAVVGQRAICLAGVRDPIMIQQMDVLLDDVRAMVAERYDAASLKYTVDYRLYGRDAVMGSREPVRTVEQQELGLLIDVVAPSLDLAEDICAFARSGVNHNEFPGCRTSAGNLALAFSPSEIRVGPVYGFNIWHLLPLQDPCAPFQAEIMTLGAK